jgi:hypothetical protein
MKRILTVITGLLLLLGCSTAGWGQNFSTEFLKHVPKKHASVATVNKSMIEALKKEETNKELLAFLSELSFLRIITIHATVYKIGKVTFVKDEVDSYCDTAVRQVREYAQGDELLNINDETQQSLLIAFHKTADNKAGEIVFIHCDDNMTLTIVNITGNISIGNLGKLSSLSQSIKKSTKNL